MRRLIRQCRVLAVIFVALGALTGVAAVFYGRHTGRPVGGLLLSALSAALALTTAVGVTLRTGRWRPWVAALALGGGGVLAVAVLVVVLT